MDPMTICLIALGFYLLSHLNTLQLVANKDRLSLGLGNYHICINFLGGLSLMIEVASNKPVCHPNLRSRVQRKKRSYKPRRKPSRFLAPRSRTLATPSPPHVGQGYGCGVVPNRNLKEKDVSFDDFISTLGEIITVD